jgi:hypothetical protein
MHIGATRAVRARDGVLRQPAPGHGCVVRRCDATGSFDLQIEGVQMRLGIWWLDSAMRGGAAQLPLVNLSPEFGEAPA